MSRQKYDDMGDDPDGDLDEQYAIAAAQSSASYGADPTRPVSPPEPLTLIDAAREVVRFYGTDRTWSLAYRTLLGSRIDDLAATLDAARAQDETGLRERAEAVRRMPSLAAYEALVNDLLAATPAPDTGAEERLRAALIREIVAYYKLYDHQEVWNERGATALVDWLMARGVLSGGSVDEAPQGGSEQRGTQ
jgi:hypothetical protein